MKQSIIIILFILLIITAFLFSIFNPINIKGVVVEKIYIPQKTYYSLNETPSYDINTETGEAEYERVEIQENIEYPHFILKIKTTNENCDTIFRKVLIQERIWNKYNVNDSISIKAFNKTKNENNIHDR